MKKNTKWLTTIGLSAGLLLGACSTSLGSRSEATVLTVGDYSLTESEFVDMMTNRPMGGGFSFGERILEEEIITQILETEYGDTVTDKMVYQALEELKEAYGGDEAYEEFLEDEGFTDEYMKGDVRSSLLFEAALYDVHPVSEDDLREIYDYQIPVGTRVAHILVEDKETAEDIIKQIDDGADFSELVQEHSIDEGSLFSDGEYTIVQGDFEPAFEEASLELEQDEYTTTPVETSHGFHIIKSISEGSKMPFEESLDELEEIYYTNLFQMDGTVYESIIYDLIEKHESSISVTLPEMKNIVARMLEEKPSNEPVYDNPEDEDDIEILFQSDDPNEVEAFLNDDMSGDTEELEEDSEDE